MHALRWGLLLLVGALLAGPGHADDPFEALGPGLGSTDPDRRFEAERTLLRRVDAVNAFPRLLELAKEHEGLGPGRGALEALNRLAAPSMTTATDGPRLGGGGPERTGAYMIQSHAGHPVRILPSVKETLDAPFAGSERFRYTNLFVGLAAITQQLEVAFVFDVAAGEVAVMTPTEAIAFYEAWWKGPGREALAWSDFLRAQQGAVYDGLDRGMIDVWLAQLLGDDAAARRRAAYVLGRCVAAEDALRAALAVHPDVVEPVLARHDLRRLGDVVLVSERAGSPNLWRMRLDGGGLEQLTDESVNVFIPKPSPDGRRIAYHHDTGERGRSFAVLDLKTRETWRPDAAQAYAHGWSPDGRHLSYVTGGYRSRTLRLLDTKTGESRDLGAVRTGPMGRVALPIWSADGSTMVYPAQGRPVQRLGDEFLLIRRMDGRDTLVRRTAEGGEVAYPRPKEPNIQHVVVAPHGGRAVVSTMRADRNSREEPGIYLYDLAGGSEPRRIGQGNFAQARFAPNGTRLALNTRFQTLTILDAKGERIGESRANTNSGNTAWAPDGETLYAAEILPIPPGTPAHVARTRYRLVRRTEGGWEVIRDLDGDLLLQRVTPDGRWLILASEDTGDRELIAASTDGRLWINLTEHPADDHSAVPLPSR